MYYKNAYVLQFNKKCQSADNVRIISHQRLIDCKWSALNFEHLEYYHKIEYKWENPEA